jgi:hypothetical protein
MRNRARLTEEISDRGTGKGNFDRSWTATNPLFAIRNPKSIRESGLESRLLIHKTENEQVDLQRRPAQKTLEMH